MEYFTLKWLLILSIFLWVVERFIYYGYIYTKPLSSVELFFMLSRVGDELIDSIKKIVKQDGSDKEKLEKFQQLLEQNRPNKTIRRKIIPPPNIPKDEDRKHLS